MKKLSKNSIITIIIILGVIIIAIFALIKGPPVTDKDVAKCIGDNSVLYTRLGCSHCKDQEDMFGDNLQYLNIIDCFFEQEKCIDIASTPTWIIKGKMYIGIQTIDKLKELTGC